jgi:CubicO group peptidase (beta-lactamase class C family)
MLKVTRSLVFILLLLTATAAGAADLTVAKPEQVGLSSERLGRITEMLRADVEKGRLPGAVALVARKGRVAYFEAVGFRDKAAGAPLRKDDIFRIYSMTKPFTSVAILMLRDDGKLDLNDPVSKYLPQLAKLPVGVEKKDDAGQVTLVREPSRRDMTIQDLLRHTSGLTYGVFGSGAVKKLYGEHAIDVVDHTNADLIDKLAKVPLMYQPGTTWEYGRSTDVLGRVIEVVSGKTLSQFLDERLFRPLKMVDTSFWVRDGKQPRLAQALATDPDTQRPISLFDVTKPPKFEGGGQAAVSTTMDYARFTQMLLNRGRLAGARLLSRKTVEQMTADHLGPMAGPSPGYGFGLGFAVRREVGVTATPGSVGDYHWSGLAGTTFWVDPKEELIVVWMMQAPGQRVHYRNALRSLVYQAIND